MGEPSHHHREFTLEHLYPNCVAHVWAAWSVAEKKAAWLGSSGFAMEFRPGGFERSSFVSEMGEHTNTGCYFEIQPEERIVLAYSMALNGRVHSVSLATITFADENGGTRLTFTEQMCVIPPSDDVEIRRHGWGALLDGLSRYLAADTRQPA